MRKPNAEVNFYVSMNFEMSEPLVNGVERRINVLDNDQNVTIDKQWESTRFIGCKFQYLD